MRTASLAAMAGTSGVEIERRWVVDPPPDVAHPLLADADRLELEQVYLRPDEGGGSHRVRSSRTSDGTASYTSTQKQGSGAVRMEHEQDLDVQAFEQLRSEQAYPTRSPVRKTRYRVHWQGRLWELDDVREPVQVWMLECELPDEASVVEHLELPPPCAHAREVTDVRGWSNSDLARGSLPTI